MECTLAALIACFSWSGLYIDTGIEVQDVRPTRYMTEITYSNGDKIGGRDWEWSYNQNPYGRFGIGYQFSVGSFTWDLEAKHVSSLDTTSDRGVNSLSIGMRWRPFH